MSPALAALLAQEETPLVELVYMAAALCFVLGLKRLSGVKTARAGNALASAGMGLAFLATILLLWRSLSLGTVLPALVLGATIGAWLAVKVRMTAMPELVALLNGLGGAASAAVALAEVSRFALVVEREGVMMSTAVAVEGELLGGGEFAVAAVLSILIGAVTLAGSLVAWAKLAGKLDRHRIGALLGSGWANLVLAVLALLACAAVAAWAPPGATLLVASALLLLLALALGVGLVVPIGGADMPVVISLLNSYSGLAASATGFVLENNLLIVAGTLVGASGLILTRIMCRAMNRSLANVLFGGFGQTAAEAGKGTDGYTKVKSTTAEEVAPILAASRLVIVVPGYGLAVAQAQHKVRELSDLLEKRGATVKYGIHPVAGRMPGHMNVLLAEADVPYEQLYDLDQIDGEFKNADVAIVVGANDVCNPAAVDDPASPIAGMPVLHVWDARTVLVIKRSLSPGYAGIPNELFQMDNTLMLFKDAKEALEGLIAEVKAT